jgi:hypothetical protein
MNGVFYGNIVCYSLQMEKLMVEVTISLAVLCGGNCGGSMLYLWVFVGGFHSVSLVGRLLTVMVTTPSYIWCYGVDVYDLNHLLVTAYRFPPGRGLILCYWYPHNWSWVAIMPEMLL